MQLLEKAEKCYKDVLVVDPKYARAVVNLAAFYHSTATDGDDGRGDESMIGGDDHTTHLHTAYELYKRALELEPENLMAKHAIASLSASSGVLSTRNMNKNKEEEVKEGTRSEEPSSAAGSGDVGLEKEYIRYVESFCSLINVAVFFSMSAGT
jgi:tetratricopeptide (TPR) repeat protein